MNQIEKLIDLLLSLYEVDDKDELVAACTLAFENPNLYLDNNDAGWLRETGVIGALEYALGNELAEYLITGDKIDEIHEVIDDQYVGELGEFPGHVRSNRAYYVWLNEKLVEMDPAEAIIEIGDTYSDSAQLVIVYEKDVEQIKALCQALNVHCKRTTED